MQDFKLMRENMVKSQIGTVGVTSEKILNAFSTIPREAFVPSELQNIAYCDEDINICDGRYLVEPSIIARLLEYADLKSDDVALTIGSGAGYTAALLSKIVSTVVSLEENNELLSRSQKVWDDNDFCNIVGLSGKLNEGAPDNAPYSLIIINGCVSSIPDTIKSQLSKDGGRILAVIQGEHDEIGHATIIECNKDNVCTSRVLFDASTPYLSGFEPKDNFEF